MSEELQQKLRSQLWTVANTLKEICQQGILCISPWIYFLQVPVREDELRANDILKYDGVDFKEAWSGDDERVERGAEESNVFTIWDIFGLNEYLFSTIISKIKQKENILPSLEGRLKDEDSTIGQESEDDFGGLFSDIDLAISKLGKTADDRTN